MNLDELKTAWNTENTNDVRIPSQIKQLGQAKHPLDKLKRKMKGEFYMQSFLILFVAFIPKLLQIDPSLYVLYYAFYALSVAISAYYLNHFRLFYNKINHYTADTKDSLLEVYYEFKLNIERYHAFSFLLLPIALVTLGMYKYSRRLRLTEFANSDQSVISFTILTLTVSIITILIVLAWTRYLYSPYLKELKKILDELKEEEIKENSGQLKE